MVLDFLIDIAKTPAILVALIAILGLALQKHTKISSEEISDGRKYSLLFLYDKVEVSC
ncbi:hypothetical protein [Streptococcus suis]|uniref:Uncharacterized protein n=1 Tax=Streptococcus suis TaxID=1307 RepID=A0AB37G3H6_STRSU|nr:hypothetical protein [Streptococcus suis]QOE29319.1 hypothetical protein SSU1300283_02018 [Streptococcus suis]